jgi:hypothetical protein
VDKIGEDRAGGSDRRGGLPAFHTLCLCVQVVSARY